jgi:hypothetical protein
MGEPFGDSATQHKVGGGRIYGGKQTSTQVVDLPDWAKPYAKESLGQAAALTDTSTESLSNNMKGLGRLNLLGSAELSRSKARTLWLHLRLWALRLTWLALRV